MATKDAAPLPTLETYDVLAPIARGGMAEVFLGRAREGLGLVALKIMRADLSRNQEFVSMFVDEARIASRLDHPNIVKNRGAFSEAGRHFLVMDLVRGRTLLDVVDMALRRKKHLPYAMVAWVGARIADALHYAHELEDGAGRPLEVIHRDVSPSNILVTFGGEPKLIDFGLAKAKDRITSTAHGVLKGKLAYVAPEQVNGAPYDRRADVFALGITLWEVSIGDRLFRAETDVETVRKVSRADVPDPRTIREDFPAPLAAILLRALARDPAERYATAGELAAALDAFVNEADPSMGPEAVAAFVAPLYPDESRAPWERTTDGESRAVTSPGGALPTWRASLDVALGERIAALPANEAVARARALLERALVEEWLGEPERAEKLARASGEAHASAAAWSTARRLAWARRDPAALLPDLDRQLSAVSDAAQRADLLAERGRLLHAAGDPARARAEYTRALGLVPEHAAAMRGLDAVLNHVGDRPALAAHLAKMSDAYDRDPGFAAWLEVERAVASASADEAKAALEMALERDPSLGPVRAACVAHAAAHADGPWLVALLLGEADLEVDANRAASLELEAAIVARHRLGDLAGATAAIERASARPTTRPLLRRMIVDELVRVHERSGRRDAAIAARRVRLTLLERAGERAVELMAIAMLEESGAAYGRAAQALTEAHALMADDETVLEALDRVLERAGADDQRVKLWTSEATRRRDPRARARCLGRAATLAEAAGDAPRAIELHRAALVAAPADEGALDALDRLLRVSSTGLVPKDEARAKIALHRHAAEHAPDDERRVAHLEVVALLEEEALGEPGLAAMTYRQVLRLAPTRVAAWIGLARAAQRSGDVGGAAEALLKEAELPGANARRATLTVRAASLLSTVDVDRAVALLDGVLERDSSHREARLARRRLYESGGRWQALDIDLAAAVPYGGSPAAQVDLLLARARIQRMHLKAADAALTTAYSAIAIDPTEARAHAMVAELLDEADDKRAEEGWVKLAELSPEPMVRARLLVRAGDIAEHALGDDGRALALLSSALDASRDASFLEERATRVARRRAEAHPAANAAYDQILEVATRGPRAAIATAELALRSLGRAPARALALAEALVAEHPRAPFALRLLERAAAENGKPGDVVRALVGQADTFSSAPARIGALWEAIRLTEWKLSGDPRALTELVRSLAPDDVAATEHLIAFGVRAHRGADGHPDEGLVSALRSAAQHAPDETSRLGALVSLALAYVPAAGGDPPLDARRACLDALRLALRIDARSIIAATGLARLGPLTEDAEAAVAGLVALADLATGPKVAQLLGQAASAVIGAPDSMGPRAVRLDRAARLLERALEADPDALVAATMLIAVHGEIGEPDRLLAALGGALSRAKTKAAVAGLGAPLARVARERADTRVLAVDALRRVVEAAPTDADAWLALSEVSLELGARAEAATALENVVVHAREAADKIAALAALAELYRERGEPSEESRVLAVWLEIAPRDARALARLERVRRQQGASADELRDVLVRLVEASTSSTEKASALVALADDALARGDVQGAERHFIEAAAQDAGPELLARLRSRAGDVRDEARLITALVARAEQLGRPHAAAWEALGRLEIESLGEAREGVAHLNRALALSPGRPDTIAALARGLVALGKHDDASARLVALVTKEPPAILGVSDVGSALAALETALREQGRRDESVVARELRALAGALDDGAHVELRARRSPLFDAPAGALDVQRAAAALLPDDARTMVFALTSALAGVDAKLCRSDLESLDVNPRQRITSPNVHPLAAMLAWVARLFGIDTPPLVFSPRIATSRVLSVDGDAWVALPSTLAGRPEPEQLASVARAALRIALAVAWIDEVPSDEALPLVLGIARRVVPGYGQDDADRADDWSERVGRAVGRKQKKALAELERRLQSERAPTVAEVLAFRRGVAQAEARAAFVLSGDLLATLDALRAGDSALSQRTEAFGPAALGAVLTHPIGADLVRFALGASASTLRTRLGG